MKEFFRQVLSGFGYRHRQTSIGKPFRRVRPNLELLEGRDLPSISSNLVPTVSASLGGPSTLQGPTPVVLTLGGGPVQKGPTLNFAPNMTGATFIMYYGHDYTGSFHIFKITNMTGVPGSSNQFTFNGFWDEAAVTGTLTWQGNYYSMQFSWQRFGHQYQFNGNITAWDESSGLMQIAGWETLDQSYQYFMTGFQE